MLELGIGELGILVEFVFVWGSKRLKTRRYIWGSLRALTLKRRFVNFLLEHGDALMDFLENMQKTCYSTWKT